MRNRVEWCYHVCINLWLNLVDLFVQRSFPFYRAAWSIATETGWTESDKFNESTPRALAKVCVCVCVCVYIYIYIIYPVLCTSPVSLACTNQFLYMSSLTWVTNKHCLKQTNLYISPVLCNLTLLVLNKCNFLLLH